MLTAEENERLTRVGPGTPAGELLRRYWQPVALAEELPLGAAPVPVRILGEDLVLFRDESGQPGLLGIHCSHRGADLSYGRLEDGGLRCIYHGWLYDRTGRCLEQPGEPAGSTFHERIRHTAYPCVEKGGLILAYLGRGQAPLVPAYDFLSAEPGHSFAIKMFQECSYLQGNEGNQDPIHLSFLHRLGSRDRGMELLKEDIAPQIDLELTDWGLRIYSIRTTEGGRARYVRLTNAVLPNITTFRGREGDGDGCSAHWHVPVDDTHHWKYAIAFRRDIEIAPEVIETGRTAVTPDYHHRRNRANRYLQDRAEMQATSYAGMGRDFQAHDTFATESQGPVQDRTQEHLGHSDIAIVTSRKLLLKAIADVQAGRDPQHVVRDPAANSFPDLLVRSDVIPAEMSHRGFWNAAPSLSGR